MNFTVYEHQKKKLSRRAVYATLGGKIALALVAILLIAGTLLVIFYDSAVNALANGSWGKYTVNDDANAMPVQCGIAFCYVFAPVTLLCAYRQRNAGIADRKDEQLSLRDNTLYYRYHKKSSWHERSIDAVEIPLAQVSCTYDKKNCAWDFEGDIHVAYCTIEDNGNLAVGTEETKPKFSIGAYFGEDFDREMQRWATRKEA